MERIVVLHSFPEWLPLTQKWMFNQIRFLPEEIENHVLCENTANLEVFSLPNIHCFSSMPRWRQIVDRTWRKLGYRRHLKFSIKQAYRHRAQILHSHFGNVGWQDVPVASRVNLKHAVSFYGFDATFLPASDPRWLDRYAELFESAACVLCEGPHLGRSLVALGCPEHKVRVHHLGIETGEIPFKPRNWANARGPLRVLIAASFQEKKGIPFALKALGELQDEVPLEVTLIGDANEEARSQTEKRKILEIIKETGLGPRVRMLGYQPHRVLLEEAYRHQLFLSPSITAEDGDTEGGAPVTIIEMAASGMAVVSTNHCDIPEIIRHGETGLLAEEKDVHGLVHNIRWLLQHTQSWSSLLDSARRHIEGEYNAVIQGLRLAEIYLRVLDS
jgi:colanic acid/amylovoran biosynthesis glycosyltransferase